MERIKMKTKVVDYDERWVNNVVPIWKNAVKPCKVLGFCVYGGIVEMFPIEKKSTDRSCEVFGHDCPVFYNAEAVSEEFFIDQTEELDSIYKFCVEMRKRLEVG